MRIGRALRKTWWQRQDMRLHRCLGRALGRGFAVFMALVVAAMALPILSPTWTLR